MSGRTTNLSLRAKIEWIIKELRKLRAQISSSGGSGVTGITGDSIDNTDPSNPIINAIPLSGTTGGNPVTGDISYGTLDGDFKKIIFQDANVKDQYINFGNENLYTNPIYIGLNSVDNFNNKNYIGTGNSSSILAFESADGLTQRFLLTDIFGVRLWDSNPLSEGLKGNQDFTPNITDLAYVQKKYIDSLIPDVADNYASDVLAAAGGILVGGLYHTAGTVKIRLS